MGNVLAQTDVAAEGGCVPHHAIGANLPQQRQVDLRMAEAVHGRFQHETVLEVVRANLERLITGSWRVVAGDDPVRVGRLAATVTGHEIQDFGVTDHIPVRVTYRQQLRRPPAVPLQAVSQRIVRRPLGDSLEYFGGLEVPKHTV